MSEKIRPIICTWRSVDVIDPQTGAVDSTFAMVPIERHRNIAGAQYAVDEEYPIIPFESRSQKSHGYYFAALRAAYDNLSKEMTETLFPNVDHFRRWLLIEAGFFVEKRVDLETEQDARRLATFVQTEDVYARITLAKNPTTGKRSIVIIRRAKSQDHASMDKATFQASSKAVLELASQLTKTPVPTLVKEGQRYHG